MHKLYPTASAGEMKTHQNAIFERAAAGPIVIMSKSVPKAVLVSPDEWNATAERIAELEFLNQALMARSDSRKHDLTHDEVLKMLHERQ